MWHHVQLSFTKCRMEHNFADDIGGALIAQDNVKIEIRETIFTGNSASGDGGALWVLQSECYSLRSVFRGNTAKTEEGGALHIDSRSLLNVKDTNFTSNNGSSGGGIYIAGNSMQKTNIYYTAVIENCRFLSNNALTASGGAINLNNPEHVSVRDTLFLRNEASGDGGAMRIHGGTVNLDNVRCIGNYAWSSGGCLDTYSVTLKVNNSDISQNFIENGYGVGVHARYSRIQVGFLPVI